MTQGDQEEPPSACIETIRGTVDDLLRSGICGTPEEATMLIAKHSSDFCGRDPDPEATLRIYGALED